MNQKITNKIYIELSLQTIIKYLQHNDHINYSCEESKNSF